MCSEGVRYRYLAAWFSTLGGAHSALGDSIADHVSSWVGRTLAVYTASVVEVKSSQYLDYLCPRVLKKFIIKIIVQIKK